MRIYALAVYLFLYIPIGIIALFSFNAGKHASQFTGFSVQWYGKALDNPFVTEAFQTSLIVALSSALLATVFGTMAALAHRAPAITRPCPSRYLVPECMTMSAPKSTGR